VWLIDLDHVNIRHRRPPPEGAIGMSVTPDLYHVFESVESAVMAGHLGSYDTYGL
jgi:hypothetical protein